MKYLRDAFGELKIIFLFKTRKKPYRLFKLSNAPIIGERISY